MKGIAALLLAALSAFSMLTPPSQTPQRQESRYLLSAAQ